MYEALTFTSEVKETKEKGHALRHWSFGHDAEETEERNDIDPDEQTENQ